MPKVFISHASEDKSRFVVKFAERLLASGVEAWLDLWEMQPGDSLVSKIFDEGIGTADCVIVVLSTNSVNKPWVREELEAAVIRAVQEGVRVIPLRIEPCEVPRPLHGKIWSEVFDLENYDREFNRLLSTIFGRSERPPLGMPPDRLVGVERIPGLDPQENSVLEAACKLTVDKGDAIITPAQLLPVLESTVLSQDELADSIEILGQLGFVQISSAIGMRVRHFRVTPRGLRAFARSQFDVEATKKEIIARAVNLNVREGEDFAQQLSLPEILVNAIMEDLNGTDVAVRTYRDGNAPLGMRSQISWISPRLKRHPG